MKITDTILALGASMGLAFGGFTPSAEAYSEYPWRATIGDIEVYNWYVDTDYYDHWTEVGLDIDLPYCRGGWQGNINISYYSDDQGYLENYKWYPTGISEYSGWIEIWDHYLMSESGYIYVDDNIYCTRW